MKFAGPMLSITEVNKKLREGEYLEEISILVEEKTEELIYFLESEECGLDRLRLITEDEHIFTKRYVSGILEALNKNDKCSLCSLSLVSFDGIGDVLLSGGCRLQFLELSYCKIDDEEVTLIAAGISRCRLRGLKLIRNNITEKQVERLAMAIGREGTRLQSLYITEGKVGDEGAKSIAEAMMGEHCVLQELRLTDSCIGNEGISSIAKALTSGNCDLHTLDLITDTYTSQVVCEPIVQALKTKECRLRTLKLRFLNYSRIIAESRGIAKALCSGLCKLKVLDLSESTGGDNVLIRLGNALGSKKCRLKSLHMRLSHITDEGMNAIVDVLRSGYCTLQNLGLSENNIGDQGVHELANAFENGQCSLQTLDLTNNPEISSKGIKKLKDAIRSGKYRMKCLWLGDYYYEDDYYDYDYYYNHDFDFDYHFKNDVYNLMDKSDANDSKDIEQKEISASSSTSGDDTVKTEDRSTDVSNEGRLPKEMEECTSKPLQCTSKAVDSSLPNEGKWPDEIKFEDVSNADFASVWDYKMPNATTKKDLPKTMRTKKVKPEFKQQLETLARLVYPSWKHKIYEVKKEFYMAFTYENCERAKQDPKKHKVNWARFAGERRNYSTNSKRKPETKPRKKRNVGEGAHEAPT